MLPSTRQHGSLGVIFLKEMRNKELRTKRSLRWEVLTLHVTCLILANLIIPKRGEKIATAPLVIAHSVEETDGWRQN